MKDWRNSIGTGSLILKDAVYFAGQDSPDLIKLTMITLIEYDMGCSAGARSNSQRGLLIQLWEMS